MTFYSAATKVDASPLHVKSPSSLDYSDPTHKYLIIVLNSKKAKNNSIIVFFQHATCTLVDLLDRQSHPQLVCVSYHFSVHRRNILSENSTSVRIKKVHNKLCKISIPAAPSSLPYPCRFSLVG
ncbi:hypothetical protein LR48_Vigan03g188900 [Vigna angularis]|uniref:Uncharacterized protein n=1 Tax=Phaseolus angularis TaxID=3914 RepID=A0A0L9U770_PHAAN|nr:hypothetical protein LR48_Vigan03g188900 [Vigna angularis]